MVKLNSTILAIETSCDETACAVIEDGVHILANVVSTQIRIHEKFGGVVPEVASRKHLEYINAIIDTALDEANRDLNDLDAIAVTFGPGLVGALWWVYPLRKPWRCLPAYPSLRYTILKDIFMPIF